MDHDERFQLDYLRRIAVAQIDRRNGEAIKYGAMLLVAAITLSHAVALPDPGRIAIEIALWAACATLVLLFGITMQHLRIPSERDAMVRRIKREESRSASHFTIFRYAAVVVVLSLLVVMAMSGRH